MDKIMKTSATIAALMIIGSTPALSHGWYSNKRNPVTHSGCCGVADCAPLPPGALKFKDGNYIFRHTDGKWYSIPANQALPSEDGKSHGCVWGEKREAGPSLCIFIGGAT